MSFLMDSLHQAYLITNAENICNRVGISYIRVGHNEWIIEGKLFLNIKEMLESVYSAENWRAK